MFLFLFKKKILFQFLAKLNKLILPSLYKKDMKKLKKVEMLIIAYRYWVTKSSL
ncbi:MAG: SsrA-binding protein [Flavobacteriales bacterium]|nr:SsrA-binding protein [Flavobacteriales bacterium]